MAYRSRSTRARSYLLLFATVVVGVAWMGCATTNGDDPADEDGELGPAPTSTPKADAAPRPDFEAGFPTEDSGIPDDPTPDGGGDTCVDNGDPGSSEPTAKALADTTDGVDTTTTIKGVMNGPVDVDFYKLNVADVTGGILQPDIRTQTLGVELCVFVRCTSGKTTTLKTCAGGAKATNPGTGTEGCCGAGPANISPDWDCPGFNDSASIFFRVRPTGNACLPYTFSYVF